MKIFCDFDGTISNNDLSLLENNNNYILFYFTASWCKPCQKIKPSIQSLSDKCDNELTGNNKLVVYMVDIDDNDELVKKFNIRSVPTFILIKDNNLLGSCNGDLEKLRLLISNNIN